jgi:hypothetical protein
VLQTNGKRKGAVSARCDCGVVKAFIATNLKNGNSKSCGCRKFDGMKSFNKARAAPQPWVLDGDVATLTICGVKVLVDADDLPLVNKYRWGLNGGYAVARGGRLAMHRLILGLGKGDPREGDHVRHNTADNRRSELRIANSQQNKMNRRGNVVSTSMYKGVCFDASRGKYKAAIKDGNKPAMIGRFDSEVDAALAYNAAAANAFGEFAYLNEISFAGV